MTGAVLSRHELRWVLEQAGTERWPYPLRAVSWPAETDAEAARHRALTEAALRDRGLLAPAPARALLRAGELVGSWRTALDLVRRDADAPRAAVVLTDGTDAVLLASTEYADAPVRLAPATPDRMPETLMSLVPPCAAGVGGPWPVPAALAAPSSTTSTTSVPAPSTDRTAHARAVVDDLVTHAGAFTEVGAAGRPEGRLERAPTLVSWLDGPRGRFAVRRPPPGITRPAVIVGVNDRQLLADIHTVLGEAGHRAVLLEPRPPGRSTA